MAHQVYTAVLRLGLQPLLRREFKLKRSADERAVEYAFAMKHIARLYPKSILEVGAGKTSFPHLLWSCGFAATAIDKLEDTWANLFNRSTFNRHFYVIREDVTRPTLPRTFELITCISVLEHIPDHALAMRQMFNLLEPGGHAILTFPYHETHGVDRLTDLPNFHGGSYGSITRVFSRGDIELWLRESKWDIVEQAYFLLSDGTHYGTGQPVIPPVPSNWDQAHQLSCLVLSKRRTTNGMGIC